MFFRIPTSNSFYFFYDSDITYVYISLHILSLQFLIPQSTIQVSSAPHNNWQLRMHTNSVKNQSQYVELQIMDKQQTYIIVTRYIITCQGNSK